MENTHSVRFVTDGYVREVGCMTYFDAAVVADAIERRYANSEIWQGSKCLRRYDSSFSDVTSNDTIDMEETADGKWEVKETPKGWDTIDTSVN